MKRFFIFFLLLSMTGGVSAASRVEDTVYFRNGTSMEFTGRDRMLLPKKVGNVKAWRNIFGKKDQRALSFRGNRLGNLLASAESGTCS